MSTVLNPLKWSIPTVYNGQRFRSKLEADWAEFFDIHRIQWAYESEGFDINGVRYLPDFYLPALKTVVEVKGVLDDADSRKLWSLAVEASACNVQVILAEAPVGARYSIVMPSPAVFEVERLAWNYAMGGQPSPEQFVPIWRTRHTLQHEFPLARRTAALAKCTLCDNWQFIEMGPPSDETGACRIEACQYIDDSQLCFDLLHPADPSGTSGLHKCFDCLMQDKFA